MKNHLVLASWVLGLAGLCSVVEADEGMWPLYDLGKLPWDSLKARGMVLSPEEIYDPGKPDIGDAVINVGGGSASFVSGKGLIITNHHVAFAALQRASTVEHNYVRDGFFARTLEEEIPAVGYNAMVSLEEVDVTADVMGALEKATDELARYMALDSISKALIRKAEKGPGVVASVEGMAGGTSYVLYTYLKLSDVRIVHAPPASIGDFGGEIDNWMWPRHVGDYTFLRAYVGPDGAPADYSPKNEPYRPKSFLTVSKQGIAEGSCAILVGYPGKTNRHAVSNDLDEMFNHSYVSSVQRMGEALKIIDMVGQGDPERSLRLSSQKKGVSNYFKKTEGQLLGFRRDSVLARRQAEDAALREFIASDEGRTERYGWIFPAFDSLYGERAKTREKRSVLGTTYYVDYLTLATQIYKWVKQRERPDAERDMGYQDRDSLKVIRRMEQVQINLVEEADKTFFGYYVGLALALPEGQRLAAIDSMFAGLDDGEDSKARMAGRIKELYAKSKVGSKEERLRMMHMSREELMGLGDPMIELAGALAEENEVLDTENRRFEGAISRVQREYVRARLEWGGGARYPDANGTKRFNFGTVTGYHPRDAVAYDYLTSLTGVLEKEQDEEPFLVPAELKRACTPEAKAGYIDHHAGDVPVDFLTTNDGTNGNSGSPVLDGRGRLIGLDFDTNLESVIKDYYFNGEISRAIVVDIRYVLFLLDRVYGLTGLLDEMRIE